MSEEDKLEIEKKKLEEKFEIEDDQLHREIQRTELLSNIFGDMMQGISNAMLGIKDVAYVTESEIKEFIRKNETFFVKCDDCGENFEVENIKEKSDFKCSNCNLVWHLNRDKFYFEPVDDDKNE